ncbi:MAG: hypothetical protein D6780_02575, partial [Candidatus Dadabacteria bacterium]
SILKEYKEVAIPYGSKEEIKEIAPFFQKVCFKVKEGECYLLANVLELPLLFKREHLFLKSFREDKAGSELSLISAKEETWFVSLRFPGSYTELASTVASQSLQNIVLYPLIPVFPFALQNSDLPIFLWAFPEEIKMLLKNFGKDIIKELFQCGKRGGLKGIFFPINF